MREEGGGGGQEEGWICSISEHTELVQGRELNDGLKGRL